jgi:glucose-6-phosphate 1-dehydrogenase
VLTKHKKVKMYKRGTWGPKEANSLLDKGDTWHEPGQDAEEPEGS